MKTVVKETAVSETSPLMKWLLNLNEWLLVKPSKVLYVIAGFILVSQVLVVLFDTCLRYLPWTNPLQGGALEIEELQMGMLSAMILGYTWFVGGHIRIELLRDKMSPRLGACADALAGFCGLVYAGGVSLGVLRTTLDNWALDATTDVLGIHIAPFQLFFTMVFIHLTLILLVYTIQSIYRIKNPEIGEATVEKNEFLDV